MKDDMLHQNGELGEVLRQVSGQLKSSLGNIYLALERIAPPEKRDADEKLDINAAVLCQSYYRILRLANNLADAAELDGAMALDLRNDDIVGFCREILRRAEDAAILLGLELEFRCDRESHIIAMDAQRLERMLLNLLSNAFKFTPKGGKVTLEVRAGRQVEIRVTDTGCGISQERLETVFERYRQGQFMDPPPHGLGLGLPICRRIAQEHGGSILLTSRLGEGTTVVVSLPNKKSNVQQMNSFVVDYSGGFNRTLLELADALPRQAFARQYLD